MKINKISISILIAILIVLVASLIFSLKSAGQRPYLERSSVSVASPGDVIVLYGNHFGNELSRGRIYLNDKMLFTDFIQFWSNTKITLVLPDDFKSGMVTIRNMFGSSDPYLITSSYDVPGVSEANKIVLNPIIESAEYTDYSRLKIEINGDLFGQFNDFSGITLNTGSRIIDISDDNIISWKDNEILFYLENNIRSFSLVVKSKSGESNSFEFPDRVALPVNYSFEDPVEYRITQRIDLSEVNTLGNGYIDLYIPLPINNQRQESTIINELANASLLESGLLKREFDFYNSIESSTTEVSSNVTLLRQTTGIRSDLLGRNYDPESPEYIKGFLETPNVDENDNDLSGSAVWIVRNSSNRYNQINLLTDWIRRYIELNEEGSDNSSVAFKNRVASEKGMLNIAVSMFRAAGIPTRIVSGVKILEEPINYSWLEFYLPYGGWVPMDFINIYVDNTYEIGTLENNLLAFTKGVVNIEYLEKDIKTDFYALLNNTINIRGNIESYKILWHNITIK